MRDLDFRIEPLGDQALVIELAGISRGRGIDEALNRRACALASCIQAAAIVGVTDVVPTFTTVGVHYRPEIVQRRPRESPSVAVRRSLAAIIAPFDDRPVADAGEVVDIPVCYGGEYGPDLEDAAERCGLRPETLIALHQPAEPLRVFMIGFAPGAPYIGLLDERLSLPRRATPRLQVAAGSVAIANRQCVIYPNALPGGWNVIGRTPLALFDATREPAGLLRPGTRVRFRAISERQLSNWPETVDP